MILRRSVLVLAALALVAASCGGSEGTGGTITVPAGGYDLDDPELQASLGVPEPTIAWTRTADRVQFVGAGTPASPAEVDLLAAVVAEVPAVLDTVTAPRWVVRATDPPARQRTHPQAVAYAFGPDIYLLDGSFELSRDGSTRFDLARAYIHELAHVAQFRSLSDEYIAAALAGELTQVDPTAGSTLLADFAAATGWIDETPESIIPSWSLSSDAVASTAYGATHPGEDMAESVALVMLGLADLISPDRVGWVERWLGTSATELARGRPWAPAGSVEVASDSSLWDGEAVERLAIGFDHVEPLYFQLPPDAATGEQLVGDIERELRERLMAGELEAIDDPRLPRFGGRFLRQDGSFFWVELWDFREADPDLGGPTQPILVYVAIW